MEKYCRIGQDRDDNMANVVEKIKTFYVHHYHVHEGLGVFPVP